VIQSIEVNAYMRYILFTFAAYSILSSSVSAQDLSVRVYHEGKPAVDAVVCAGSLQEPSLYALTQTDSAGLAKLSKLPAGRFAITSDLGDRGQQTMSTVWSTDQAAVIALPDAANKIRCQN